MPIITEKAYAIDASRVCGFRENELDPDAPDAVWVPVVSTDRDECNSPEARTDVGRYVTSKGAVQTGIDKTVGPTVDKGQKAPIFDVNGPANQGVISQEEYLRDV